MIKRVNRAYLKDKEEYFYHLSRKIHFLKKGNQINIDLLPFFLI